MEMPTGICRLCLKSRSLRDSHFIPGAMYKRLRDTKRQNPNPIVVTRQKTATTSKQMTDYVLCAECEQRFNKNGEDWMLKMVGEGRRFPLNDRLALAIPVHEGQSAIQYSADKTGIDTEKLGYFALSMLWRGAVHEWKGPFGDVSQKLALGATEEAIRRYLLSEAPFPNDIAVIVNVCTDRTSREFLLQPVAGERDQIATGFEMITLGVHFLMFIGPAIPPIFRQMCCVTSKKKLLFRRDCSDRLGQHYASLAKTSARSADIQAEWPE